MLGRRLGFFVRSRRQVDAPDDQGLSAGHAGIRPRLDREHLLRRRRIQGRAQPLRLWRDQSRRCRAAGVFTAAPNPHVFGGTKAAVAALTRAVATDFVAKGIRCNCICPGTIETPSMLDRASAAGPGGRDMFVSRQPMGRLGTAEEIASLAVYLASHESAFTTGVAHIIDGGWTL